ncbi:hypothetical protein [Extensimonas vulgaris]|uniref:hypothetical protein n=1 Tax=Extensimonas vulgaris TaxID=1031594 RepID=UPI000DF46195|nr:hypothetical protein [Extensimonas vulgaris]TXD14897.1 hypothetical protein FUT63_07945 [Extensimonas vulgaris]
MSASSVWHATFGDISVMEPQYRHATKRLRPFARSAGVRARGCSRLLQRVVTDFAADPPFAKAMDKLVEHYGIVLGESTIRHITLHHAQAIHRVSGGAAQGLPEAVAPAQTFIVQTDGTMVPTVRSGSGPGDRRKGKSVQWQEANPKACCLPWGKQHEKAEGGLQAWGSGLQRVPARL